jgi:hypothetical protein
MKKHRFEISNSAANKIIWNNFYKSFSTYESISQALNRYNGIYNYTPYSVSIWVDFDTLEDLIYFILKYS